MAPLDGEQMVLEADNKALTITTHRVRYSGRAGGSGRIASIMLDAVTGCEVTHTTYRAWLMAAVLSVLVGFYLNSSRDSTPLTVGALVAGLFVVAYLATRRQVLRVASASTQIDVRLVGMSLEKAAEIVDTLEWAKNGRYWLRETRHLVAAPVGSMPAGFSQPGAGPYPQQQAPSASR